MNTSVYNLSQGTATRLPSNLGRTGRLRTLKDDFRRSTFSWQGRMMFSASSEVRNRNAPINANQIGLQPSHNAGASPIQY
jgi:hypothetical protein